MMLISFLGQAIGFLIFIGVIVLIVKSTKLHPEQFELMDGKRLKRMLKGITGKRLLGRKLKIQVNLHLRIKELCSEVCFSGLAV